jgi:oligopeptide transport system ATP-binding protein
MSSAVKDRSEPETRADEALLEVENLEIAFRTPAQTVQAVRGVSFSVAPKETFAIVGESGSGKTVSMMALMRLLQSPPAEIRADAVRFEGADLMAVPQRDWWRYAGEQIAMVFQDALTALNPVYTVGWQIAEMFRVHRNYSRNEIRERSIELLRQVGIPEPERRLNEYPHQFSGGMRQRAMIAMAIALEPKLLIADEPTTALDVTVQAQIMDLLQRLKDERDMSLVLITHDLGLVAETADHVAIMYAGSVMETGTIRQVLGSPTHPYTLGLLASRPQAIERGQKLRPILGSPPNLAALPDGCAFRPRCPRAMTVCASGKVPVVAAESGHDVVCHAAADIQREGL